MHVSELYLNSETAASLPHNARKHKETHTIICELWVRTSYYYIESVFMCTFGLQFLTSGYAGDQKKKQEAEVCCAIFAP